MQAQDSIELYLHEIGNIPILTPKEEQYFAERAAMGDPIAKDKLIESNLRLVVSIAKHYIGCGVPFQDLIQEGNIGLMKAIEKYDLKKGFRFSTYATWWIKQTISRCLANQSKTIRIPANMAELITKVKKVNKELFSILHRPPTTQELANKMGISEEEINTISQYSYSILSLDLPIGGENDEVTTISSFIADPNPIDPIQINEQKDLNEIINQVLMTLSPREANILQLRFGLNGKTPMTLEEVGKEYGLTKERIRQIETKALQKLRNPTRSKILKEYIL